MARLEEEKSRNATTGQANGSKRVEGAAQAGETFTEGSEATSDAMQPDITQRRMAELRARLIAERKSQKDASAGTPADRMAALKAKLKAEKEARLAQEGA